MTVTASILDKPGHHPDYKDAVKVMSHGTMALLRASMRKFGMSAWGYEQPELDIFGYHEYRGWQGPGNEPAEVYSKRSAESWLAETGTLAPVVWRPTATDPESGLCTPLKGIADHKLTGDAVFWWVTTNECEEALDAWRAAVREACDPDNEEQVSSFITSALDKVVKRLGYDKKRLIVAPRSGAELLPVWQEWLAFLARGANERGFQVH